MRDKKQDWEAYEVIFFPNLQSSATCNYLSTSSLTHSPNGPYYFTSKKQNYETRITNICNFKGCHFGSVNGHSKLTVHRNLQLLNYKTASLGIIVFWEQSNPPHLHSQIGLIRQKAMLMINNQHGRNRAPSTDGGSVQGTPPSPAFLWKNT